jgi:hypothetical protein
MNTLDSTQRENSGHWLFYPRFSWFSPVPPEKPTTVVPSLGHDWHHHHATNSMIVPSSDTTSFRY